MEHPDYKDLIQEAPFGYAYHKVICNKSGKPVDYIFLSVNRAFETCTGKSETEVIGKRVTSVLPDIGKDSFDWIGTYGAIALNGGKRSFEQYSFSLKRWYRIQVYSNQKGYFSTIFTDITQEKVLSDAAQSFIETQQGKQGYQKICDDMLAISGARYAVFNLFDRDGRDFTTMAISGLDKHFEKAIDLLGFELRGKRWKHDPERLRKLKSRTISRFESLGELAGGVLPSFTIKALQVTFGLGEVVVVKVVKDDVMMGDFTLFIPEGQQLQNETLIETFSRQIGLFIERNRFENELKHFYSVNLDLLCILDTEGKFLRVNDEFERLLGYGSNELERSGFLDYVHEDDLAETEAVTRKWKDHHNEVFDVINRYRTRDHSYRYLEWRSVSDGNIVYAAARDVTKRLETEEAFRYQSDLQEVLMNMAFRFINVPMEEVEQQIDLSLAELACFTIADRAYIFDLDAENGLYHNSHEWCREGISSQKENLQSIPAEVMENWLEMDSGEKVLELSDIRELPADSVFRKHLENQGIKSLLAIPIVRNGNTIGLVGFDAVLKRQYYTEKEKILLKLFSEMLVNIRTRVDLEKQLIVEKERAEQANQAKSVFLANMSHEVRTPLNGIIGFMDLLKSTPINKLQQQYLENVDISARTLLSIVNDILDLSKIEAGKLELDLVKTDLIEFMQESAEILKYQASEKNLELTVDIAPDMPRYGVIDPLRLRQVLVNLLSNAVKFTEQGSVVLAVSVDELDSSSGRFRFSVTDTGMGITGEQKKQIFKAFSQGDATVTRRFGGTGLGLVISNLLVQKMGGTIELDSRYGEGSSFAFSLDIYYEKHDMEPDLPDRERDSHSGGEQDDKPGSATEYYARRKRNTGNPRILVVDDNALSLLLIRKTIEQVMPSVTVLRASNGKEALEWLKVEVPDLLLMDIQMPVMDGIETTKRIRQSEREGERLPVVALSSGIHDAEVEACRTAGVDDFLEKPIRRNELKKRLNRFLPVNGDNQ